MMQALISVIVPIYNVKAYLEKCLDGILCQTYTDIEIILVDDGSTDGCADMCDAYAARDNRIKVVHKENGGLVSARKAGVEIAKGDYITFVDGDDWIDYDTYESLLVSVEDKKCPDIIAYGYVEEYGSFSKKVVNQFKPAYYTGEELNSLKKNILMGEYFFEWNMLPQLCSKIIKKNIAEQCIKFVDNCITFGEDAACSFPCMLLANSLMVVDAVPYHYRQREGSIVKSEQELPAKNFIQIYHVLQKAFCQNQVEQNQLTYYMYFLLLLKSYSAFAAYMLLFPFDEVKKNARIYLYGAGGFGRVLKKYIEDCSELQLAGWTDSNAEKYRANGLLIDTVEELLVSEYDYLVVSILNEKTADAIRNSLEKRGIARNKILIIQKDRLASGYLPVWVGAYDK